VKYTGNEVLALHFKHGANGRWRGWLTLLWVKKFVMLKYSSSNCALTYTFGNQIGSEKSVAECVENNGYATELESAWQSVKLLALRLNRFESYSTHHIMGWHVRWGARDTCNVSVGSSILPWSTKLTIIARTALGSSPRYGDNAPGQL
jgi:hypothetical protein